MNWYTNLKIRVKLLVGFTILIFMFTAIGIVAIFGVNKVATDNVKIYEGSVEPLSDLNFMTRDVYLLRMRYRDLVVKYSIEELNEREKEFARILAGLRERDKDFAIHIEKNPEQKEMFEDYKNTTDQYVDLVADAFQKKKEGREEEFLVNYHVYGAVGISVSDEKLRKLVDYNIAHAAEISEESNNAAFTIILYASLVLGFCVIISILIALYIAKVISTPLRKIEAGAQHIAKTGDLTAIPDISLKDEIGNVHRAMAQMVNNFAHLVKNVIFQINNINTESQGLAEISDITANATVELQAQTQTASNSSEQVSVNVAAVSHSVDELATAIKEISMNTTAATTLTRESEKKGQQASEVMNRLGQSSQEIGNIVKSITGIAEQTNLLALNATIEAARAGEMGKGFAVVANEVKDLAKESARAADDITHKIKVIQEDTKNAIDVLGGIIENITKINEVTTSIAAAVEEQSVTTSEVNKNIIEATTGVTSIVEVVVGITEAVAEYSRQSNNIKVSATTLKNLGNDLDIEIKTNFKV